MGPYFTPSSLGLLQLLQECGISASPHPQLNYNQRTDALSSKKRHYARSLSADTEERQNLFSLNLVEKLQSLGLHRVAARGMSGHSNAEQQKQISAEVVTKPIHCSDCSQLQKGERIRNCQSHLLS